MEILALSNRLFQTESLGALYLSVIITHTIGEVHGFVSTGEITLIVPCSK